MSNYQKLTLLLLRLSLGFLFLYAGISHIQAGLGFAMATKGYLSSAAHFQFFYQWLASDAMLPITTFVNTWAPLLLGVSLILGIFVKYSAPLGALLMLMYYFVLPFPHPNPFSYIIDEHIIYAFALLVLAAYGSGKIWGIDNKR